MGLKVEAQGGWTTNDVVNEVRCVYKNSAAC